MLDESEEGEITRILRRIRDNDPEALDQLFAIVIDELRARARAVMAGRSAHSLQPSMLVNEAYLRLFHSSGGVYNDRKHFFRVASRAMRCVLVDHIRAKGRIKRAAGKRVALDDHLATFEVCNVDQLALNEALTKFGKLDPRGQTLVELKYYLGLSDAEAAEILEISVRTVERDWGGARAFLMRELS